MKNTITDLNNYLFEQLERLYDSELTDEQLNTEMKRADSVVRISEKIIENAGLALKTMQHLDRYTYEQAQKRVPAMLEIKGNAK